ncbi:prepilin-type N-terminal cleavage/methylation domain-containing protein [Acidovorax sp. DW039]|uniref:prepilin-type N-terminal cleavage/methylation domain-containing protein n=1 Tax=Acidovorax sp. DW039 TaxID=3095606 RepID=UPI0030917A82|nr:prepilin-type N-terminal cleavage/methylation domain-containing protein [Acidovorax sp. DW039]
MSETLPSGQRRTSSRRVGRAAFLKKVQKGFTLVELAIVLAVIGLIIGAIAIGKDVQRNAEYTKIKNKFVDQWEQAYNQYYQRAGVVLGDSQTQPRLMVNGENYKREAGVVSGGNMTEVTGPGAICNGSFAPGLVGETTTLKMREMFSRVGVRMPPGRAEGFEDRYVYLDTNGNPQEVQVCFRWNNPGKAEGSGNVMVITGLTPDLARMLDQMIDGKPDAQEGRFRQMNVENGTPNGPGAQWAANNQIEMGAKTADATSGRNHDEDQVMTVVGIYKMNQ